MARLSAVELKKVIKGVRETQVSTDLEVSTFQKRPAYRYLRESDNLPVEAPEKAIALVKLFDPTGSWTWYIAAYLQERVTEAQRVLDKASANLYQFREMTKELKTLSAQDYPWARNYLAEALQHWPFDKGEAYLQWQIDASTKYLAEAQQALVDYQAGKETKS